MKIIYAIILIFLIFVPGAFSKETYYGGGFTLEESLHGLVGTVRFAGEADQSKFVFHAKSPRYELVLVSKTKNSIDFIRIFSSALERKDNGDGFELVDGKSYGIEFSSTQPMGFNGPSLYWGYFTGVKMYDWEAVVRGDMFTGKHWIIPGGVDIGLEIPASPVMFTIGFRGSMAFGQMKIHNLTTQESYQKIAFGYESHLYSVLAVKF